MKRNYTILRMYTCFPGIITRTLPELFARFGFCRLPLLLGLLVFLLLNSIARAQYCSPANFPNADRVHLTDVIFNTISNTGTPFSANGYGNYTAMSTTISSGTTYNLTVKIVSNFGRANYLRVWCDWNRNNSFADEGEEFVIGNTAAAPGTYNFTTPIAVPATASAGSTRMRVMVKQQIDPSGDPCNSSNTAWDGEAEDYTLVLCGAAAGASISTPTGCMGASETLTVSGYGAGTIQWQRSTDGVNYTNIAGATSASITTGAVSVTTYYRVGVTSGGCTGYTLPVTKEVIVLTTTATPTSYCASGSSNLNAAYSSTTGSITNSTDYAIPDGAGNVSSPIAVSNVFPASIGASTIVSVCINITHTWLSDLKVDLIAPTGAVFVLSNGNGGGGDNYTNTCFSTTAASNINAGGNAPPYSGTYRPQGGGNFNTTFAGINPNGTWNLRVSDGTPGDAGMIRDWTITFSSGISWSPSTGLSSTTVSNPVASPASTTTYTATLYVPGKTCSPASDVTVTVNPIPGLSITSTTHVSCNGGNDGSITASASGTGPYTYNWTGSRTGATINTLTAGTYVVTVTDGNGCTRSSSVTITQPAALTSSFNVTSPVCEGENSTITYTGNGTAAGTYTWNFNGGSVVSGSGSGPYSVNWSSSGSKTVTLQVSENGCTSVLTTKTVAVDPGTAVGTISSSASTVCSGASVTLTLAGHVGSVQWQSSSDNSTWTNIAGATSSSYTTPALSSSTYFRAVVTSGTCPGANTSPVLVTVHSASVAGTVTASANPLCAGSSTTLTLTGNNGSIQWQSSPDGSTWSAIPGATTATYNTPALSSTTYYRAVVTNGVCPAANSPAITITVYPPSAAGTVSATPNPVCSGNTTVLSISSNTGTIQWQSSSDGSVWSDISGAASSPYTTAALTASRYYRAVVTSGVCAPAASPSLLVTVDPASVAGTVTATPSSVCSGSTSTLTAAGYTGSLQWQSSSNNTTWANIPGEVSSSYTTAALTANMYYRVVVTSGVCPSASSPSALVTVSPVSAAGTITASANPICSGSTTVLTLSGNTGTIQWQSSPDNVAWTDIGGASAASYTTPALSASTYYRVVVTSGACPPAISSSILITVNPASAVGTVTASSNPVCSGSSTTLGLTSFTGNVQWQSSANNITWANIAGATTGTYTTGAITATSYFRAVVTSPGCPSVTSGAITITVSPPSAAGTVSASSTNVCAGGTTTLTLTTNTGTIQWESSPDNATWADVPGAAASPYTTPALSSSVYYRVRVTSGSCSPAYSNSVLINVSPSSVAGTPSASATAVCSGSTVTLTLAGHTGSVQWQSSPNNITFTNILGATSATYTSGAISATTYYRAVVTSGPCPSATSAVLTITISPASAVGAANAAPAAVCPGGTSTLTLGSNTGAIQWQSSPDNTAWADIGGATASTYVTPGLTATMYYRAIVTSGTCAPAISNTVTVTVNPEVVPSVIISASPSGTICAGTTVTFSAAITNGGASPSYQWKLNGSNVGSGTSTYSSGTLSDGDVISCVLTSAAACANPSSVSSNSITMDVTPTVAPSVTISGGPDPSCAGQTVSFTATPANGGAAPVYQWKVNGVNSGTGASFSSTSLNNSDVVVCQLTSNADCPSPATVTSNAITVTVNPVLTPSITISASANPICAGQTVTFTSVVSNGGSAPSFQWKLNGVNVGTGSPGYSGNSFADGDQVTCILTSSETCASSPSVTSNTITVNVSGVLTPAVTITGAPNPACAGEPVTFTATETNGGSTPAFQWKVNGSDAGTNSSVFVTGTLSDADQVSCVLTSSAGCANPVTATSNPVTMTVNPVLVPSINVSASSTVICEGEQVSFSAVATNEGPSPVYQWKLNGVNVGSNSPSYTSSSLANGDQVSCVLTSNATCADPATVTSGSVTITVNPVVVPAITVSASSVNICAGDNVSFTTLISDGGSSPSYQWKLNGANIGSNSASYSTASLADGDVVSCVLTSNATCADPSTVSSNQISVTVNPVVAPTVSISASSASICEGETVTFNATVTGEGNAPVYQWKINGINAGSGSPAFSVGTLSDGDQVMCELTSNATCANPAVVASNVVTVTVTPVPVPSITVSATATTICAGETVSFSATITDGGTAPSYQWTLNGVNVGTDDPAYSGSSLSDGDQIKCVLTSNAVCANPSVVSSNTIDITVVPLPVAVVNPDSKTICSGQPVNISVSGTSGATFSWTPSGTGGISGAAPGSGSDITDILTTAASGTLTYVVTPVLGSCTGDPAQATVTVEPLPALPQVISPVTYCEGETASALSATGSLLLWYGTAAGGAGSAVTPVPATSPSGTYTFYVSQTEGGCEGDRAAIEVIVNPLPLPPVVDPVSSVCEGTPAPSLSVSGASGLITWYSDAGLTVMAGTGSPFSSGATAAVSYWVTEKLNGCEGPSTRIDLNFTPPDDPAFGFSGSTFCISGSNPVPVITGLNGGVFSADPGVTIDPSTGEIDLASSAAGGPYNITYTTNGPCPSSASVAVTLTSSPDAAFSFSGPYCLTDPDPFPVFPSGSSAGTFSAAPSGLVIDPSTGKIDLAASAPGTYSVTNSIAATAGCAASLATVSVEVLPVPVVTVTPAGETICNGGVTGISLSQNIPGSPSWIVNSASTGLAGYSDGAGSGIAQLIVNNTGSPGTLIYTISPAGSPCPGVSVDVTVTVQPQTAAPVVTAASYCENEIAQPLTAAGSNLVWYTSAVGGSGSATAPVPSTSVAGTFTYYVTQTAGNCESSREPVLVNVNPVPAAPAASGSSSFCEGSPVTALTASGGGGVYKWYNDPGLLPGSQVGVGSGYVPGVTLPGTYDFYVTETSGGCTGPSAMVTVVINPRDNSAFSYGSGSFCITGPDQTPVITGLSGGIFSCSLPGLVIDPSTGTISVSASSLGGPYPVTYTTNGICPGSSIVNVTITNGFDASFTYADPFCQYGVNPFPVFSGGSAGTFSAAPAGLSFVNPTTGEIDMNVSLPGTYTVTNDISASGGCASVSATYTVTIDPAPAGPVVSSPVNYCQYSAASPLTASGSGLLWYTSPSGGTGSSAAPTPSTAAGGTTDYYVTQTVMGCESQRVKLTVLIDNAPPAPAAANPIPYCEGGAVPALTAGGTGGTLTWYSSPVLVPGNIVGTGSSFTPVISGNGVFSFWVTETAGGCEGLPSKVDVTVNAADDASFSYGFSTFCLGGPDPAPTVTGLSGGAFSASPAGLLINPVTGLITLSGSLLNTYTVSYQTNGSCPTTGTQTVSIVSSADAGFVFNGPYCQGGANPSPVFTTGTAGVFSASSPSLVFANSAGTINLLLSAPGTYTVTNTINTPGCPPAVAQATVTINPAPPAPSVNPLSYCQGAVATPLTAGGLNLLWYPGPAGGAGTSVPPLPSTGTTGVQNYYVSQTVGGCEGPRSNLTVTVNAVPSEPTAASPVTYCQNAAATALVAGGSGLRWYSAATGGVGSAVPPVPGTAVAGTASYYVSQNIGGCESSRKLIVVIVNAAPAPGVTSPVIFCLNDPAAPLTASGTNLLWYGSATGGAGSAIAPVPVTTSTGTTTYYVSQSISGCESLRSAIVVNVTVPSAPLTNDLSYCFNQTGVPALTATGSNLLWYASAAGGTGSSVAPVPSVSAPGVTFYYVSQTAGTCESPRAVIKVTVNQTPDPVVSNVQYCQDAMSAALTATGTAIRWYDSMNNLLAAAPVPGTSAPGVWVYYATQTDPITGCESNPGVPLTVTVLAKPAAPVAGGTSICQNSSASLSIASSGPGTLTWFDSALNPVGSGASFTTPLLSSTSTYYVSETDLNGCESDKTPVVVTVNPVPSVTAPSSVSVCQNSSVQLSVNPAPSYSYTWMNPASQVIGTGSSFNTGPLTFTSSYYVYAVLGVCTSSVAGPVVVNVTPLPQVPSVSVPSSFCSGSSATLTAISPSGATFTWYDAASGGSVLFAGNIYTFPVYNNLQSPAIQSVWVESSAGGCASATRQKVDVTVVPVPGTPVVSGNTSVCLENSFPLLNAQGTVSGGTLDWYGDAALNNLLFTGSQYKAPGPVTGTTTFWIAQSFMGCRSVAASHTLTALPLPAVSVGPFTGEGCSPVSVSIASSNPGYITKWVAAPGDTVSSLSFEKVYAFEDGEFRDLGLSLTDTSSGCRKDTTFKIKVHEQPQANFARTPGVLSDLRTPAADFINLSTGGLRHFWNFGDGDLAEEFSPSHEYVKPGKYTVTLIAQNDHCSGTYSEMIEVIEDFTFWIPDVFTPNGDGINDVFSPKGRGIVSYEMLIYNRWGNEIFKSLDMEAGWDGRAYGNAATGQNEIYVYKIRVVDHYGKMHNFTGKIAIAN